MRYAAIFVVGSAARVALQRFGWASDTGGQNVAWQMVLVLGAVIGLALHLIVTHRLHDFFEQFVKLNAARAFYVVALQAVLTIPLTAEVSRYYLEPVGTIGGAVACVVLPVALILSLDRTLRYHWRRVLPLTILIAVCIGLAFGVSPRATELPRALGLLSGLAVPYALALVLYVRLLKTAVEGVRSGTWLEHHFHARDDAPLPWHLVAALILLGHAVGITAAQLTRAFDSQFAERALLFSIDGISVPLGAFVGAVVVLPCEIYALLRTLDSTQHPTFVAAHLVAVRLLIRFSVTALLVYVPWTETHTGAMTTILIVLAVSSLLIGLVVTHIASRRMRRDVDRVSFSSDSPPMSRERDMSASSSVFDLVHGARNVSPLEMSGSASVLELIRGTPPTSPRG